MNNPIRPTRHSKTSHGKILNKPNVPSPQVPFQKDSSSIPSAIRPVELSGQAYGRTSQVSPRKQLNLNQVSNSQIIKIKDLLPSKPNSNEKTLTRAESNNHELIMKKYYEQVKIDEFIESFFLTFNEKPLHTSIENFILSNISSANVIFWHEIASIQRLYSPKLDMSIPHNEAIVGYAFSSRTVLKIPVASQAYAYSEAIDGQIVNPKSALLLFPLQDNHDNIIGVVEVQKRFTDPNITESEENLVREFMKKFRMYSHWLMQSSIPYNSIVDLMNLFEINQFLLLFQKRMKMLFHCRLAEIWRFDKKTGKSTRYILNEETIEKGHEGIIGSIYEKLQLFNCSSNKMHSSYFEATDGKEDTALLAFPMYDKSFNSIFTIALRAQPKKMFTTKDEGILTQTAPFILTSFKNSIKFSETLITNKQISTLSEITNILPIHDGKETKEMIIEKSMNLLESITNCDRATLYVADHKKQRVYSIYAKNLKEKISLPMNRGLSGYSISTAQIHNTADAYEDYRFDSSMDLLTGYKTKSVLTVPIVDADGVVINAVQLLNKKDWTPFNQLDIDSSKICGTICSCLITNVLLNDNLNLLTKETKNFYSSVPELLNSNDYESSLMKILTSIREITKTEKIIIYLADQTKDIFIPTAFQYENKYQLAPENLSISTGVAASCRRSNSAFYINDISKDGRVDSNVDKNFKNICIAPLVRMKNEEMEKDIVTAQATLARYIIKKSDVTTITTDEFGLCVGVIEAVNKIKGEFDENDLIFLKCASIIISLFLDNQKLQYIANHGKIMITLDRFISQSDRESTALPKKMNLPIEIRASFDAIQFFCYDLSPDEGDIKLLFAIFNKLDFMNQYQISNEQLFISLHAIKKTYKDTYFHNWMHAVDSIQFFLYEIEKGNLLTVFHSKEIMSIVIALLFAYSEHDGTNNTFQFQTTTPLGSLFERNSLTMARCFSAIHTMSIPKNNFLKNIDSYDAKMIWKSALKLLIDCPEDDEHDIIDNIKKTLKLNPFDVNILKHREFFILILYRCALLSPFARPFGINLKWQPLIMNSMFYLGDQETLNGLDFSSRYNSRDHHIKPLAMIELFEKYAVPTFEVLAMMNSELKNLFENVKENLKNWRDRRT